MFRWLHNQKFDIAFLQETYSSKSVEEIWKAEWGGKIYYSHGTTHSKGVMILFKPSLDFEIESILADKNGRYLLLKANMLESSFLFSNIYAPNDPATQITFFCNLENILLPFADAQIILGGDMNCPLTPTDKIGGAPVQKK